MTDKLDLFEYSIDNLDMDGMTAISLVDFPAVEKDFILLSKKAIFSLAKLNKEKNTITGVALIPDKEIYRYDFQNGDHNVFFSEETVKQISQEFIKDNKDVVTVDHNQNANGIVMTESWIVEDPKNDKSNALGFTDLVKGTWMVSYKVNNETILNRINDGELRGFSIEAYITSKLTKESKDDELAKEIETIVNDVNLSDDDKCLMIANKI